MIWLFYADANSRFVVLTIGQEPCWTWIPYCVIAQSATMLLYETSGDIFISVSNWKGNPYLFCTTNFQCGSTISCIGIDWVNVQVLSEKDLENPPRIQLSPDWLYNFFINQRSFDCTPNRGVMAQKHTNLPRIRPPNCAFRSAPISY